MNVEKCLLLINGFNLCFRTEILLIILKRIIINFLHNDNIYIYIICNMIKVHELIIYFENKEISDFVNLIYYI